MFLGEYQHSLDPKGRITIPARFREELGDAFVVTKGLDNCLFVYSMPEWKTVEENLKRLPFTQGDARAFARFFFSGACECEIDKQGRILLPLSLREYANIDKDVVIIGVGSRVEVWSQENWGKYAEKAEASYEEISEKLVDLGL
ncbi:MAG: division/cell wall cluster transcriptional repressor MraZ [Syntrophomonadaceae bacterium]|nr:division/cell wall cluster transcriptional repressor MraZ [Syntrophomonadaceae bacterium]